MAASQGAGGVENGPNEEKSPVLLFAKARGLIRREISFDGTPGIFWRFAVH